MKYRCTGLCLAVRATAMLAVMGAAARGWAQCGPQWLRGDLQAGLDKQVTALTRWDPDGPGPLPEQLIVGGSFTEAGLLMPLRGVGRWDGRNWFALGAGLGGTVSALAAWDPDGAGPQPAQLIAASGGSPGPAGIVVRWDGAAWVSVGGGVTGTSPTGVDALMVWDPDGDGPAAPVLIAAGMFTTAGGSPASNIARWDGSSWSALGAGLAGRALALTTWDPDGDGPAPPLLIVAGQFTSAGGAPVGHVAAWDGVAWHPLASGMNDDVSALCSWDPDGDGPGVPLLAAGGFFTAAGGSAASHVAVWDGATWHPLGDGLDSTVHVLRSFDLDGDGPFGVQLVAGGAFVASGGRADVSHVARWNGAEWRAMGEGMDNRVYALQEVDLDGAGPEPSRLFAGGAFQYTDGRLVNFITDWDVAAELWRPLGKTLSNTVKALTTWDADGPGPGTARLIAGGNFESADTAQLNHIAVRDETSSEWKPLGAGFNDVVDALTSWDPDGPGPQAPRIVAGGEFTMTGGSPVQYVAMWDESAGVWRPLGAGFDLPVEALGTWDPDGPGPLGPWLIAGGNFHFSGTTTINHIARWDGAAWQPIGLGVNNEVLAIGTWDQDGPGPLNPSLVIAGAFTKSGTAIVNHAAVWDGASWAAVGNGPAGLPHALIAWDFDGDGPGLPQLVAGTERWTGSAWQIIGPGSIVYALTGWDSDGAGPRAPHLVAVGSFMPGNFIAQWFEGSGWSALGVGTDDVIYAVTAYDPDGGGPGAPQLIAGGRFLRAGGQPSAVWARWVESAAPYIAGQPGDAATPVHGDAVFTITAGPAPDGLTYQWRHDGAVISDGPGGASAGGGIVSGSTTASLAISDVRPSDIGAYTCTVSSACGSAASAAATLSLSSGCPADLNGDGVVDFGDYLEFLNRYDAGDLSVDYNGDGVVDFSDYLEFLNHYDAGC